jgi:hypothetical protein
MQVDENAFEISYYCVTVKVTPVEKEGDTQYVVNLPTRILTIEMEMDSEGNPFWQEVPAGRSTVADEVGAIIEETEM